MKNKKELSKFSEAMPLEITTCSKNSYYIFPKSFNSSKTTIIYEVEKKFLNKYKDHTPKSTEGFVLDTLNDKYPSLETFHQAAVLVGYSKTYKEVCSKFPDFPGKKKMEGQQVFFVDFYFKDKGVFLEVGSINNHYEKERDDLKKEALEKMYPGVKVYNIIFETGKYKEFKEKVLEVLEEIYNLPDNPKFAKILDRSDWIVNYNDLIGREEWVSEAESLVRLYNIDYGDSKKIEDFKKMIKEEKIKIEKLKDLISL
jgi:hypothetical protein